MESQKTCVMHSLLTELERRMTFRGAKAPTLYSKRTGPCKRGFAQEDHCLPQQQLNRLLQQPPTNDQPTEAHQICMVCTKALYKARGSAATCEPAEIAFAKRV